MPEEQLLYTEQHEDLFFLVEHLISQEAKSNFVSNMHIGRSRNDMGVTMYRMSLRRYVLRLMEHHLLLQESILQLAADHKGNDYASLYPYTTSAANDIWSLYVSDL